MLIVTWSHSILLVSLLSCFISLQHHVAAQHQFLQPLPPSQFQSQPILHQDQPQRQLQFFHPHQTLFNSQLGRASTSVIEQSPSGTSELPAVLVSDLVRRCSQSRTLSECDMCSLCQNGALCRQHVRQSNLSTNPPPAALASPSSSLESSLSLLRSLIDFTCYCVPGYTGTYCQINVNECLSMPCSNNATCVDRVNGYECQCPAGFVGDACEININECESAPCSSKGGVCVDLVNGYFCQCNVGFTGPACEINVNECSSSPCANNATCVDQVNGYRCDCTGTGFTGRHCETNIDDCLGVECQHDGTCIDGINSFRCMCHSGYHGQLCEVDIDECLSSPCIYGQCWQNSDENSFLRRLQMLEKISNASTTTVASPATGSTAHHVTTTSLDLFIKYKFDYSKASGYWCECTPGYTGSNCEIKRNECESSPCGPHGKCIDLVNEFRCVCLPGYTGRTCVDNINECETYSPCAPNTKCYDLVPDYQAILIKNNEKKMIESMTESQRFDLMEKTSLDGYYCDCNELNEHLFRTSGNHDTVYAGQNCTIKLNACESLKHLCKHDSVCKSTIMHTQSSSNRTIVQQDIMCLCKPGYTGKYCDLTTTFRMDGTYSLKHYFNLMPVPVVATGLSQPYRFHMKFEFRVKRAFRDSKPMPLIYLESFNIVGDFLLFETALHHDHISVINPRLGLIEKLGFYYADEDSDYENLWHSLEIMMLDENTYELQYGVRAMRLSVQRRFNLINVDAFANMSANKAASFVPKMKKLVPTSFTLGKSYNYLYKGLNQYESQRSVNMEHRNDHYLNNMCIRDFSFNGVALFKSSDSINSTSNANNKIKFGCDQQVVEDQSQCGDESSSCGHQSTCVNAWFNYDCLNCQWPFYGKKCQFEATKIAFVNKLNQRSQFMMSRHEALLSLSLFKINTAMKLEIIPKWFQMSFMLHRIAYQAIRESNAARQPLTFLLLKQQTLNRLDKTKLYYLLGISTQGYLTLRKIQTDYDLSQFSFNLPFKVLWSLQNDKISLNQFRTSYSTKIGLKLNENLVEISINESYVSRYELALNANPGIVGMFGKNVNGKSSSPTDKFQIEAVKFQNFDSIIYLNDTLSLFKAQSLYFNSLNFLVYDLSINENYYVISPVSTTNATALKLTIMDDERNFLLETRDYFSASNLITLNGSVDDFKQIDYLNENYYDYCSSGRQMNRNPQLFNTSTRSEIINRNCFQSQHFKFRELSGRNMTKSSFQSILAPHRLNQFVNVTCVADDVKGEDDKDSFENPEDHLSNMMVRDDDKIETKFMRSTCKKYGSVKRLLFSQEPILPSTITAPFIYFLFDLKISDESSEVVNNLALENIDHNQAIVSNKNNQDDTFLKNLNLVDSIMRQRRFIMDYQDLELYSLAFDLNLNNLIESDYFQNNSGHSFKTNLFTLNTFDETTQKFVCLFGMHLNLRSALDGLKYEFEIFTNKQLVRTEPISLSKHNELNLTFTANSIELRLNNYSNSLIRLSDQYFNLFYGSLLKGYNSFQLNITTYEFPSNGQTSSTNSSTTQNEETVSDGVDYLVSSCLTDFRLTARRPILSSNQTNHTESFTYYKYSLVEQTRSVLFYQTDLIDTLQFDSQCVSSRPTTKIKSFLDRASFGQQFTTPSPTPPADNCYLVTKVDLITNQEIVDYYDCNCSSINRNDCTYSFWSKYEQDEQGNLVPKNNTNVSITNSSGSTCLDSMNYACFNNATCVDNNNGSYSCMCVGPFSGKRCEKFDPCLNSPCSQFSTCSSFITPSEEISYTCECHEGYAGANCRIKIDETCLGSPCLHGSTCMNQTFIDDPDKLDYKCICPEGFEGKRCELRVDFCVKYSPCANEATCINLNTPDAINVTEFYECRCVKGWRGVNCTQDVDECWEMRQASMQSAPFFANSMPCSGNGQCINTKGSFKCICNEFYYGDVCQSVHVCQQHDMSVKPPCRNGGVCLIAGQSIEDNKYECKCAYGYTGDHCDYATCDLQPCEHGATCDMINATHFECNCNNTGYAGIFCETRINKTECHRLACFGNLTCDPHRCDCTSINCDEVYLQLKAKPREYYYHLILWPLLGIMVTLLIVLFSMFAMRVKKSRATRGTYSPSRHEQQASRIEFNMDLKRPPDERLI